jgi:hypothetical protein
LAYSLSSPSESGVRDPSVSRPRVGLTGLGGSIDCVKCRQSLDPGTSLFRCARGLLVKLQIYMILAFSRFRVLPWFYAIDKSPVTCQLCEIWPLSRIGTRTVRYSAMNMWTSGNARWTAVVSIRTYFSKQQIGADMSRIHTGVFDHVEIVTVALWPPTDIFSAYIVIVSQQSAERSEFHGIPNTVYLQVSITGSRYPDTK